MSWRVTPAPGRGGSRISGTGVRPLKKGTHGVDEAPLASGVWVASPQKNLKIRPNMRFPGIWDFPNCQKSRFLLEKIWGFVQ
jgi:hypothetical protein